MSRGGKPLKVISVWAVLVGMASDKSHLLYYFTLAPVVWFDGVN